MWISGGWAAVVFRPDIRGGEKGKGHDEAVEDGWFALPMVALPVGWMATTMAINKER